MAIKIQEVTHSDNNKFKAVGEENNFEAKEDSSSDGEAMLTVPGWIYLEGIRPTGRTGTSRGGASSSKLLLRRVAAQGGNSAFARYVLLESAAGGFVEDVTNRSNRVTFSAGQFIDVMLNNPIEIQPPQTYVAASDPESSAAIDIATGKLQ